MTLMTRRECLMYLQTTSDLRSRLILRVPSLKLKLTFSPLKMDGWNTSRSYWVKRPIFRGYGYVSFREGTTYICNPSKSSFRLTGPRRAMATPTAGWSFFFPNLRAAWCFFSKKHKSPGVILGGSSQVS